MRSNVVAASCAIRMEKLRGHDLAALDEPVFVRFVISYSVVHGAHVVPHQHIAFLPQVLVLELGLQLVFEQEI